MARENFCTYFDANYLIQGIAMIESLQRELPSSKIFVVTMDEISRYILKKINFNNIALLPFHTIEHRDFRLLDIKKERSLVEYYWTNTPVIINYIFENYPHIENLTYLDADLYFYYPPNDIFLEMGDKTVAIHPHRFPPTLKHLEVNGIFNVGWVTFKNQYSARSLLRFWKEECLNWCYNRHEKGLFGDQVYLNKWPQYDFVHIIQHQGAGVAPWNHEQYRFTKEGNSIFVDNLPLIFYHFHGFKRILPTLYIPYEDTGYKYSDDILKFCILPYVDALFKAYNKVKDILPSYTFGYKENYSLRTDLSFICHNDLIQQLETIPVPQNKIDLNSHWKLFKAKEQSF